MSLLRRPLARALFAALACVPALAFAQSASQNRTSTWSVPTEGGWGMFTLDQGNVLAASWFSYDEDGEPTWFLIPNALVQGDGGFRGDLLKFSGVPFAQIAGNAADPAQRVGEATLRFSGDKSLQFSYVVGNRSQTKTLERTNFAGKDLVCKASSGSRLSATNYSDVWSSPTSTGWGVHIAHVDDALYATWYTYDPDRESIFLIGGTTRQADGSFTGPLFRQRNGTPYHQINGSKPSSGADAVGTVTLRFTDGENATFSYTVDGVTQSKTLRRSQVGNATNVCEVKPYTTSGGNNGGSGQDECYPPLAVGDRYRIRSTPGSGAIGETDVEVVGTETYQGHPVFRIRYRPVGQNTAAEVFEFIEQTATERIHYGSQGYIPEVQAQGTTRFEPPVRTPRSTPVGSSGRLLYKAITNYTAAGQNVSSTIDFDETWARVGTETQSSPAGTFAGACKFDVTLKSDVTISSFGVSTRSTVDALATQWAHPNIGGFRGISESTSSISITGAPVPIPPTITNSTGLSEIVSASIGGRNYP
jgi:hypothetical protein